MATESEMQGQMQPLISVPLQSIYVNGFKVGVSSGDVFLVLQRNGADFAVMNLSYTIAKSLGEALKVLIERLEEKSGRIIMTSDDIAKALSEKAEAEHTT